MTHFNKEAAEWDSPEKIELMAVLAKNTQEVLKLSEPIDIMDFGCGTGLFGLEIADYAKTLVGVDTSTGMLEVFDKKTEGHNNIQSMLVDLEAESIDNKFDLVVSSMAFHHLNHPNAMITKLKTMLNPGGRLAIVDLDKEDGTFHPNNEEMGVKHFGFDITELQQWADEAGLSLDHHIINSIEKNDKEYRQFLAVFK